MKQLVMGQKVIVNAIAEPQYVDNERRWIVKIIKEKTGWYVGHTYKQEGIVMDDKPRDYFRDAYGNYLKVTKRIKLARIKFSQNSNDSFIFDENIRAL